MQLNCSGKFLDLSEPRVMGILNVTPDSFSDGGFFLGREQAVEQALRMQEEGASIIDIGGESTRPGAASVDVQQELGRVLPVIEALLPELSVPISIDTSKAEVMRQAVQAGAGLINDVNGLRADGAIAVAAETGVPVCLMHMQGEPRTMQQAPQYDDVVEDVIRFLEERITACTQGGIQKEVVLIDPGFGFGKSLEHNLQLLAGLPRFERLGAPLLVGISRKSMIGTLTGRGVDGRLPGSLAAAVLAVERGAKILRVHDVEATVDAIKVAQAIAAI